MTLCCLNPESIVSGCTYRNMGDSQSSRCHESTCSCFTQETWYYVREGAKFERKDITGESTKLKASMDCDPDLRRALTDAETGLMRPGALPHIDTATAAGNKTLLESIDKATSKGAPRNPTYDKSLYMGNKYDSCLNARSSTKRSQ